MDHLCYLYLVFDMLSRLFIAALWSPAGKGLTSCLLFVMFNCDFVTFPFCKRQILIVLVPDLCRLSYFVIRHQKSSEANQSKTCYYFLRQQFKHNLLLHTCILML